MPFTPASSTSIASSSSHCFLYWSSMRCCHLVAFSKATEMFELTKSSHFVGTMPMRCIQAIWLRWKKRHIFNFVPILCFRDAWMWIQRISISNAVHVISFRPCRCCVLAKPSVEKDAQKKRKRGDGESKTQGLQLSLRPSLLSKSPLTPVKAIKSSPGLIDCKSLKPGLEVRTCLLAHPRNTSL